VSRMVAVTEPGGHLHLEGERLVLRRAGKIAEAFRLNEVEQFFLFGPTEVSHGALMALLRHGVEVVFLTQDGQYRGRLQGPLSRHVELRVDQYRKMSDEAFALSSARAIVAGKIRNQRHLLLRRSPEQGGAFAEVLGRLRLAAEDALEAPDREVLMGIEGAASSAYFAAFGRVIKNPLFTFEKRNRRPPRDPVNACLSFGYTLLATLAESQAAAAGLDPHLGMLHTPEYGRPSLALDLIEEFRAPIVDAVTLRLLNRRQLAPDDFGPPSFAFQRDALAENLGENAGVYLGPRGRKVFLAEFFARLREEVLDGPSGEVCSFKEILRRQVFRLCRLVKGECAVYEPFLSR